MSILFYKRPDYVTKHNGPLNLNACQKYASTTRSTIPPNLSFENVIDGKTLPPCSLQDFMDYLVYVAHDAENLQFFLWYQDYQKRFNTLPESEKCLSLEWKVDEAPPALAYANAATTASEKMVHSLSIQDSSAVYDDDRQFPVLGSRRSSSARSMDAQEASVAGANAQAGLKWRSFTVQPFRHEVNLIVSHYIIPSSPRELNLSHRDRSTILHALQHTTHPSAFTSVLKPLELSLRNQAHPNFIRWSICNGNKPRVFFLRTFAIIILTLATLAALVLTLSRKSRYLRTCTFPLYWFGITNLIACYQGLCVLLYRQHKREIRPWELDNPASSPLLHITAPLSPPSGPAYFSSPFARSSTSKSSIRTGSTTTTLPTLPPTPALNDKNPKTLHIDIETASSSFSDRKLAPLGPGNTFDHEPWVLRWRRHPTWRKFILRKVRVQEEGLRIMQNRIVWQAEIWAVLIGVVVVVAWVLVPSGGLY